MEENELVWGCSRVHTDSGEILVEVSPSLGIIEEIDGVKYFKYTNDSMLTWVRLDLVSLYRTEDECNRAYTFLCR